MSNFQFDIYTHHVCVSGFNTFGYQALNEFCRRHLTQYGLVPVGYNKFERKPIKVYAARLADRSQFRFHINNFQLLKEHLINEGKFNPDNFVVNYHEVPAPAICEFHIDRKFQPFDYQIPIIDYIVENGKIKAVILQTGQGKTLIMLMAARKMGYRVVIVIKGMYVDRWLTDLKGVMGLKKGELLVCRGSKDLKNLITMAKNNELEAKVIVITNRTLYFYYDSYERFNGDHGLYGCDPHEFFGLIKAGVRVIDEVHQDFHFNFKMDLYSNIPKIVSLTATLVSDNRFVNKMYEVAYPVSQRFAGLEYRKYIVAKALMYTLEDPNRLRYISRMKTYSHAEFEKSLMRKENKPILGRYIGMINTITYESFARVMEPGQKMLIFCATIEMCTLVQKELKLRYPDLYIGRYVEEDKYDELLNSDITVSTILSAGTAVDIPGLRITLMTTALSSSQANEQALGRTRELKKWPDTNPEFLYLVCEDIPKHVEYHEKKVKHFEGKVLAHQVLSLGLKI